MYEKNNIPNYFLHLRCVYREENGNDETEEEDKIGARNDKV